MRLLGFGIGEGCDLVDIWFQVDVEEGMDRTAVIDRVEGEEERELGFVSREVVEVQKARLRREEEGLVPKNPLVHFASTYCSRMRERFDFYYTHSSPPLDGEKKRKREPFPSILVRFFFFVFCESIFGGDFNLNLTYFFSPFKLK